MPKPIIGVMGPDKGEGNAMTTAFELGKAIAENGYLLLTGGRNRGVMHEACKGAKSAGGTTIGVLPSADPAEISEAVDIPIVTGMGSARNNVNVLSSSVVVSVGMGPGTASEVALAIKAGKNVVLLDASDDAKRFFSSLSPSQVHVAADVPTAINLVKSVLA